MNYQDALEFLASYEEVLTIKEISEHTGFSPEEIMDMYDDLVDNDKLFPLKEKVRQKNKRGGIVRIHPITFDYKIYEDRADIAEAGYIPSNVVKACGKWDSCVSGYLWRYGNDVDFSDVGGMIRNQLPNLYKPVYAEHRTTKERFYFKSIQHAVAGGYNRIEIMKAINNGSTYRHMYWGFA